MDLSIYLHYPFCPRKCPYCAFNSSSDLPSTPDEYVASLLSEMRLRSRALEGDISALTLYLGGGTPSLMAPSHVKQLVESVGELFHLVCDAEITMECNPGTVSTDKIQAYRQAGVNRLSLGVQSFDDDKLIRLGRIHNSAQAAEAFAVSRDAGFDNVGIDLICSTPRETVAQWENDLRRACALNPEHLSIYGLAVEDGTPFALLEKEGRLQLPDDEQSAIMYEKTSEILAGYGYEQYEISNFARPGFRSRHNSGYWERRSCIGFGAGAHSFLRKPGYGIRFSNAEKPEDYMRYLSAGLLPTVETRNITLKDAMAERLFLGLRMTDGVNINNFNEEFGVSFNEVYGDVCSDLYSNGFIELRDGCLRLLPKARVVSNQVFVRFV